jgi:hypothetical protein
MVSCQKGDDLRRQIAISVLLLAMNSVITLRPDVLSGDAPAPQTHPKAKEATAKRARAQIRPGDWSMVKRVGG